MVLYDYDILYIDTKLKNSIKHKNTGMYLAIDQFGIYCWLFHILLLFDPYLNGVHNIVLKIHTTGIF